MAEEEKITLTKDELEKMLAQAAKNGAAGAFERSGTETADENDEDADVLKLIATFPPREEEKTVTADDFLHDCVAHLTKKVGESEKRMAEYLEFEKILRAYVEYSEDPEDVAEDLSDEEMKRYVKKHRIYKKLYDEKIRRFGYLPPIFG